MTHSFLIVGGTIEKRRKAGEEKSPKEESEALTGEGLALSPPAIESPKASRAGNSGGEALPPKEFTPSRVDEVATRGLKFDTVILQPKEEKQNITIDQVRDLQHQLSLKPHSSSHKTAIIPEAQRMTTEAQNALLKTLEEPPAHSVLVLTAPSTKMLLPTIVSRCQIVRLQAEVDLDLESKEHQQAVEEFSKLLQQGRKERLVWVEENNKPLIANRESLIATLNIWISVLRDLLLAQQGCQNLALNSFRPQNSKLDNYIALHSDRGLSQILTEALEKVIKTKNLISSTNVNPRLAVEVLLLDLPVLQNMK